MVASTQIANEITLSDVQASVEAQKAREDELRKAPPIEYDHDQYPYGPPTRGKYTPKNPEAKYKLIVSQYVGEDGILYLAGVPGRDIVPESTKHPEGLARWPEKFQRLTDDQYSRAVRKEESIEELESRLAAMKAAKANPESNLESMGAHSSSSHSIDLEASTLDHMTLEELCAYAKEAEINLPSNARSKKSVLEFIKSTEGTR